MPNRTFHISNSVHDVSCRNYIMALLLQAGFDRGTAINTEDENGRKLVEFRVSGDDKKIDDFLPKLEKELGEEFKGDIKIVEIKIGNGNCDVPDIMRSSQAHLLLQFKKATDVLIDMNKSLNEKLDNLPSAIARAIKGA
ncbi:MAG: hypothetical protein HYW05_03025 [Candidatus Diapherotrites archaeon]|nr:hypothetical protein [Candidatus Diapherotrites archaeon]